jgi:tight adherence protein C
VENGELQGLIVMVQSPEMILLLISAAIFASVFGLVYYIGAAYSQRALVRQRLVANGDAAIAGGPPSFIDTIKDNINIDFLADQQTRSKQRFELLQAGFFGSDAVRTYNLIRVGVVLVVPLIAYITIVGRLHTWSNPAKAGLMIGLTVLAYYLPAYYIKRRTGQLQTEYRYSFPDLLDLLMVCVEAGLSLEAALERVAREIGAANREIGINLAIMGAEVRAGRSTIEGFRGFAERLGLDEARALAVLLKQSLELGTDISQALRTFSDEMRDKRLTRAEEKANQLPVKLTFPMILFIFPTILIVALGPALLKVMGALGGMLAK